MSRVIVETNGPNDELSVRVCNKFYPKVVHWVRSATICPLRNLIDVDQIANDVCLAVYRKVSLHGWDPTDTRTAVYAKRTATNRVRNEWRFLCQKKRHFRRTIQYDSELQWFCDKKDVLNLNGLDWDDIRSRLASTLTAVEFDLLVLFENGAKLTDAARELKIPLTTLVRVRDRIGRKLMKYL
ncbi:MAG: hypothetical protein KGQ60_12920 [Planctomycetes bacterium]|nr:hypothetical protein [Planctomycetota bacterium]